MENVATISIHAPLAGRDPDPAGSAWPNPHFNPRAPCGARLLHTCLSAAEMHFNPRAPCGARLSDRLKAGDSLIFQSTRPLRGATLAPPPLLSELLISIHAPLAGRDDKYIRGVKL